MKTLPYPGFPTDMQPQISVLLAMANGTSIVTEGVWDNRFRYVEELRRRLSGENRPEVALCANNHIALECLQCAMQLGLRIPRDLALMTFDRYPFSQLLIPRLTAVEVDMFDMGWEAARFLVQKIKKPGLQVQTFCTTPRLLEGQST